VQRGANYHSRCFFFALRAAQFSQHIPLWRDLATIRTNVTDLPAWDTLRYNGPTDARSSDATAAVIAASAAAATPAHSSLNTTQQQHADSITSIFGEFGFPPPPSFVLPPRQSRPGFDVPIENGNGDAAIATPPALSALPRILSQSEWTQLSIASTNGAKAKAKAAKGKRASPLE
jgi:hypothetical protein